MFDVVDHSRVILKVPDETGCDYINASYINVSGSHCTYVCSPGLCSIAHQISFHVLLLFSLQSYMQESAYIASQGMYTRAQLGMRIQTCPPMCIQV